MSARRCALSSGECEGVRHARARVEPLHTFIEAVIYTTITPGRDEILSKSCPTAFDKMPDFCIF
jgi:hypothetical protein